MKIIIVGGGVAGLSLFLLLRTELPDFRSSHTVVIYEAHDDVDEQQHQHQGEETTTDSAVSVGNSIALAPPAVRLLRRVSERAHVLFKARGFANATYSFRTARGHTLGMTPTADGRAPPEPSVSCPRRALRACLREAVGEMVGEDEEVVRRRRVVEVMLPPREEGGGGSAGSSRPVVRFADGGADEADLVVGADGVRSIVKRAVFGPDDKATRYAPQYEGFCGVGSFVAMSDLPDSVTRHSGSIVFTFGPAGSFGYCAAAPAERRLLGWWSNWGTPDAPATNTLDPGILRAQLRERHGTWHDPVIRHIISSDEATRTDRIYPIWTTPDLPHWGARGQGAVLLGDAAHTLQATSGQGAAQALEDSLTFALLLAHYVRVSADAEGQEEHLLNADTDAGTETATVAAASAAARKAAGLAAEGLYEIRSPRVARIRDRARNLYVSRSLIASVVVEYLYYAYIYLWTNFPILGRLIVGNVFREQEEWDARVEVGRYLKKMGHMDYSEMP